MLDKNGMTEEQFLNSYNPGDYPRPSLTADVALFSREGDELQLLMIRRGGHPHIGKLALPGGFAESDEDIYATARRELMEETGVDAEAFEVGQFSTPGRDKRGWVISVLYSAIVDACRVMAGDDARSAEWYPIRISREGNTLFVVILAKEAIELEYTLKRVDDPLGVRYSISDEIKNSDTLAFDHGMMIGRAIERMGLIPEDDQCTE